MRNWERKGLLCLGAWPGGEYFQLWYKHVDVLTVESTPNRIKEAIELVESNVLMPYGWQFRVQRLRFEA